MGLTVNKLVLSEENSSPNKVDINSKKRKIEANQYIALTDNHDYYYIDTYLNIEVSDLMAKNSPCHVEIDLKSI